MLYTIFIFLGWSKWQEWSDCTAECDGVFLHRNRTCLQGDGAQEVAAVNCPGGRNVQSDNCNSNRCPAGKIKNEGMSSHAFNICMLQPGLTG